ncbi:MAG: YceI family protein [Bacteroidota bacterium]
MELIKWDIDPTHSEVQFKVKHLVITTVTGNFGIFSGKVSASENFETIDADFSAEVSSITTNNEQRDGHLKSVDFFDLENFPKITFKSTGVNKKSEGEFDLTGDLTIKDITKSITLSVVYEGTATDPWGNVKAGFEIAGKINRHDFGLVWSVITEAGGALVSDDVKILGNIQLVKQ